MVLIFLKEFFEDIYFEKKKLAEDKHHAKILWMIPFILYQYVCENPLVQKGKQMTSYTDNVDV